MNDVELFKEYVCDDNDWVYCGLVKGENRRNEMVYIATFTRDNVYDFHDESEVYLDEEEYLELCEEYDFTRADLKKEI